MAGNFYVSTVAIRTCATARLAYDERAHTIRSKVARSEARSIRFSTATGACGTGDWMKSGGEIDRAGSISSLGAVAPRQLHGGQGSQAMPSWSASCRK
jgi:hypothetical protein